ncbi:MAG: peroxiredoxin, partial [Candidatus Omnitrophica bacterium]|nr:peroxiredoxin [Candidatus Omnitrophota bacterium]
MTKSTKSSSPTIATPLQKGLNIGDQAPLFSLKDQEGNMIQLADFLNIKNVVLIFYPGDMTPGCTMQLCAVRDDWSKFQRKDTVVFGVNHAEASSHKDFITKYSFPFPLLVDDGKRVSAKYGATRPFFKSRIIKRTVVV